MLNAQNQVLIINKILEDNRPINIIIKTWN